MINDTYNIAPHILAHSDERVLCLPTDDGRERQGIAVFTSREVAEEMSPSRDFRAVYCGPEELERLAESLHVWLVALIGLGGDLEGSVLELDAFVGVLTGDLTEEEATETM